MTLVFVVMLTAGALAQAAMSVTKLEPPNWWAGLPENPMVLVYGAGLDGARVKVCAARDAGSSTADATAPKTAREKQIASFARNDECGSYPGLSVQKVEPGNEGYLFVWLKLASDVKPGMARFVISGKQGRGEFEFPILKRDACAARGETKGPSAPSLRGSAQDDTNAPLKPKEGLNRAPGRSAQDDTGVCHVGLAKSDVMYLIMPDRFANGDASNDDPAGAKGYYDRSAARGFHGGDLKGIEDHLAYLKELGATALWLTPFWKNANDYHGYGAIDMYAVDPHFGTVQDFQRLAAAARADGIKFFFDFVPNHVGPDHVWAKHPPLATWLHGTPENHPPYDYHFETLVDPHATWQEQKDILDGWFAGVLPDLNVDDPHVAKYLLDNAVWWMETGGLDGFRLDTFPYSSRKFWSEWHRGLLRIYPRVNTIGEVNNPDPTINAFFEGGRKEWDGIDDGLWTMFDFPVEAAIRDVVARGKPADSLQKIMRYDDLYLRPDDLVTFIGNHDMKRFLSEDGATPEKLKAALGLLMTLRGIPQLYYGDEIGMTGGDDPENRHDFPGGWKGDAVDAFKPPLSPLPSDSPIAGMVEQTRVGRTAEQEEIFNYVRELIVFRKEHAALQDGHQWTIGAEKDYFAYLRDDGKEKVLVVFNEGTEPIRLDLKDTPMESAKTLKPLMGASAASVMDQTVTLAAPKYGVDIYEVK